jgi:hypothetical protein
MDKLTELPPYAAVSFGIVLAIIFGVRYLGLWQGQHSGAQNNASSAQVAAVIVDPSALNKATAAIEAQTMEMIANRKTIERAVDDFGEHMRELARGISAHRDELMRRK